MPKYSAKVVGLTSDGTNIFVKVDISSGPSTMETIVPVFPSDTSVAAIKAYLQTIADNAPTLSNEMSGLVGYRAIQS